MPILHYLPVFHTTEEADPKLLRTILGRDASIDDVVELMRISELFTESSQNYWAFTASFLLETFRKDAVLDESRHFSSPMRIFVDSFVRGMAWDDFSNALGHSPMLSVIRDLVKCGADVLETEDEKKFGACFRALTRITDQGKYSPEAARKVISVRDRHISNVISSHLGDGDIGILFIGASHRVAEFLPKSIDVRVLHRADTIPPEIFRVIREDPLLSTYFTKPDFYGHQFREAS